MHTAVHMILAFCVVEFRLICVMICKTSILLYMGNSFPMNSMVIIDVES